MPDVKEISSAIKRIRAANGMMPSADLTYITIIPAINPLSNQHLVCKNYSLHKVELHQRGDRHFEILYQCIQTLQKSGLTVAGFIQKSSLQARSQYEINLERACILSTIHVRRNAVSSISTR